MADLWSRFKLWLGEVAWLDLGLTALAMVLAFYSKDIFGVVFFFIALTFLKIVTGRIKK
jgi:hypothetical protein